MPLFISINVFNTAKEFPDNVATMFAILETFFGLGMILGPFIGGLLYEIGNFILPFVILGGCLVAATLFVVVVLPKERRDQQLETGEKPSMIKALKVPSIIMACYSVACAAASLGFLQATLEPHLREFKMNALQVFNFYFTSSKRNRIKIKPKGYLTH